MNNFKRIDSSSNMPKISELLNGIILRHVGILKCPSFLSFFKDSQRYFYLWALEFMKAKFHFLSVSNFSHIGVFNQVWRDLG